jgi:hypothetical protein
MENSYTAWAWPWWTVIVLISVINVVVCALVFKRSLKPDDGLDTGYRKWMRIMGVVFILVGAYRSVFVSRYLAQMAWFDTIFNSSLLIRMLAVFAELSFAGLFALGMLRINSDLPPAEKGNRTIAALAAKGPYFLWLCIFIAQFFATGGLIMKNKTWFAIEETLWTLGFLAILPLAIMQLGRVSALKRGKAAIDLGIIPKFTKLVLAWCVIYCSYGLFYHLPLENWAGALNQMETGLPALKTGWSAVVDAFTIVHESKEYSDWGFGFMLWHSAYFTVCVWMSIFMMQAPRITRTPK